MSKQILLCVTGGIAAYKTPILVRRLKEKGFDVRVVLTKSAEAFVTNLTLQTLSGHRVYQDIIDPEMEMSMGHIELARWADLVLIAPATANSLAKLAQGLADDLVSTLCLATASPVAILPAMNQQMWHHLAVQNNIQTLLSRGVMVWGPAEGEQACGEQGLGRMLEPEAIVPLIERHLL